MTPPDAKFDRAEQSLEDGTTRTLDWEQFWGLTLMERVMNLSQGKFKFFLAGEAVRPRDAVTK
jgi:hypothetical protein